jgi:stage V sporulation protein G
MPEPTMLQVTSVQVTVLRDRLPGTKTVAFCRVVLNNQFQITGLRIIEGANGLFVSYPQDISYKGEDYRSICFPTTRELMDHIEKEVLAKYNEEA